MFVCACKHQLRWGATYRIVVPLTPHDGEGIPLFGILIM